jgi:hypothetical protein
VTDWLGLAIVVVIQGQAGVLPANPVPPLVVASGGTASASGRLGGIFLNPANATEARGVEASFVSFPRTGLEGFAVVASGGRRVRLLAAVWSYALTDIFDPELVEQDPTLGGLGLSMGAAALGVAFSAGRLGLGASVAGRTQTIVGTQTGAGSASVGSRLDLGAWDLGAAVIDVPWANTESAAAPIASFQVGTAWEQAFGPVLLRIEIDGRRPLGDASRIECSVAPELRFGLLALTAGYTTASGWSGGVSLRYERLRVEAATDFVGRDRLDRRVALSFSYH